MWLNSLRSTNEVCWSHAEQLITNQLINIYADVAQLAEQLICNQQVIGSSPIIGFYNRIIIAVKVLNSYEYSIIWMDSRVAKGDRL